MWSFCIVLPLQTLLIVIFIFVSSFLTSDGLKEESNVDYWWNLGFLPWRQLSEMQTKSQDLKALCKRDYGLSTSQLVLCHQHFDHIPIISVGARLGIQQCEHQFKFKRWNCSSNEEAFALGTKNQHGTKESSFAHAISAAGAVHALARSCRESRIATCGCSKSERPQQLHRDWIWGGCGDNIDYAYRFTKSFIDAHEREKSHPRNSLGLARKLINLHNNRVGRLTVYRLSTVACKCHGMSGSCSLRTCWTQLSPFLRVGQQLHERFESAIKVKFNRHGTHLRRVNRYFDRVTSDRLVYMEESPNYCAVNPHTGRTVTTGRECVLSGNSDGLCHDLCCGRGHKSAVKEVEENCFCRFHWCCKMECQKCLKHEQVHLCN